MSNSTVHASPGWCLRFLSGAVRGRSITLQPGTNVVGSEADCQILLPASDVRGRHLVFSVGELAVSVQRVANADARINGEEMPSTRRSVMVGDVITVGKIDFQIERSYPVAEHADSMFLDADAAPEAAEPEVAAAPVQRSRKAWAMGVGVWAIAMVVGWWGLSGNASQAPASDQVDLAVLQLTLKDFPETEVIAGPSGRMSVKGFVESQARRLALQRAVQPFGPRVMVNVHSVDELIDQARRFVSDPGLAVTYGGRGQLVVSGKTESADVQEKIRRLGEDLHPTVLVSDKVQYRPKPVSAPAEQRDQWAAWQKALPSRMVSVTEDAGGMRYIQLANGSLYFEGSVLKSGAELTNLRTDSLGASAEVQQ